MKNYKIEVFTNTSFLEKPVRYTGTLRGAMMLARKLSFKNFGPGCRYKICEIRENGDYDGFLDCAYGEV